MLDQHLAAFHFGRVDVVAFVVGILCGDGKGSRAAVNLGYDDACVLRATGHGDAAVHPFLVGGSHGEGTEQRDVLLLHPLVQGVVAYPSHGQVDNGVGLQLFEHTFALLARAGHRVDVEALPGEHGDERVDVLAVALHGEGDA